MYRMILRMFGQHHITTLARLSQAAARAAVLLLGIFAMAMLVGCADTPWPSWLSGEAPASVSGDAANHPGIRRIGQQGDEWPSLHEVPEPPKVSKGAEQEVRRLEKQRQHNMKRQQQLLQENVPAADTSAIQTE